MASKRKCWLIKGDRRSVTRARIIRDQRERFGFDCTEDHLVDERNINFLNRWKSTGCNPPQHVYGAYLRSGLPPMVTKDKPWNTDVAVRTYQQRKLTGYYVLDRLANSRIDLNCANSVFTKSV